MHHMHVTNTYLLLQFLYFFSWTKPPVCFFFSEHLELGRDDVSRLTFIDKDEEDCSFLSLKFFSIRLTSSRVYTLKFDSHKFSVYCHMGDFGCGDGGWTLAMKIDGTKVQVFQLIT